MNKTSNTDDTPVHQRFEPVDKPVRRYEIALLLLMEISVLGTREYETIHIKVYQYSTHLCEQRHDRKAPSCRTAVVQCKANEGGHDAGRNMA